jgi:hypothetical protein
MVSLPWSPSPFARATQGIRLADLAGQVEILTPNPKTSGGAMWSVLEGLRNEAEL